jgi:hypothetical protein
MNPTNPTNAYADKPPQSPGMGTIVDTTPPAPAPAPAPVQGLLSGVGGILLFPGQVIVKQFVGEGDPLDTSHLPITVLISAAAWYAAYYFLFQHKPKHKKVAEEDAE